MAVGRPMPPLVLSDDEVQQLQSIANSRSLPHSIVQRAQIVLACGAGETNTAIAKRMGLTGMTVGKWQALPGSRSGGLARRAQARAAPHP